MKQKQLLRWLAAITLSVLMLVFLGCGSSDPAAKAPAKPAGVVASAGDTQASLTWGAASDVTSYNVYYATTAGVTTTTGTKVTGAASGQAITGLTNGTTYYFVVTAVGAHGESVVSDEVTATPLPPLPAKVTGVAPAGGDAQATVSWNAAVNAASYNVYYGTAPGVTPSNGTKLSGLASGQAITGLSNGTTYYLVVVAANLAGEGTPSDEVSVTPLPALPGKVQGLRVTGDNGQVVMAWSAVAGATSYNVYYSTTSGFATTSGTKVSLTAAQSLAGLTQPGLTVTGLTNNTTYYFLVTAANIAGESVTPSSQSSAKPSATAQTPAKPTGVTVAPGAGAAAVSWDWVPLATSYNVYCLQSSGTPTTTTVISTGSKFPSAGSPLTITGLTPGASYWVTVTAVGSGLESGGQTSPKQVIPQ
ncbi:fibronectin type III domain-containing protein [Geomonas agri]|uniref:fibronectin type III domain-containing protein n=1 Tax=Geomonas agri TaxID=2873702 RepID=UPI001CD77AAE|nr:fibronectin type III domain-containing protein [Geomonas agri]